MYNFLQANPIISNCLASCSPITLGWFHQIRWSIPPLVLVNTPIGGRFLYLAISEPANIRMIFDIHSQWNPLSIIYTQYIYTKP